MYLVHGTFLKKNSVKLYSEFFHGTFFPEFFHGTYQCVLGLIWVPAQKLLVKSSTMGCRWSWSSPGGARATFFKKRPKTMSPIQCDYRDTTKGNLKEYVESIHEDVSYPCGQCDCRVTTKGNLKEHVQSIQEGVGYPCDQYYYSMLSL